MSNDINLSQAMRASTELLEQAEYDKALKVLDEAISDALKTGEESTWIVTVCNHAAVVAAFAGHDNLVKHYYEQSLTRDPDNPRALYGVAKYYLGRGDVQLAKNFARRCYEAITRSGDQKGRGLLDLLAKHWPELGVAVK